VSYPPDEATGEGALGRRVDERRWNLPVVVTFMVESIEEVNGVLILV
jgi:hypothetical protein